MWHCGGQERWNIDCIKTAKRSQKMMIKQPMWTITTKKLHMTLMRTIQAEWHWEQQEKMEQRMGGEK